MNRAWGHDQGTATLKTPTSLLLHPDGNFNSFRYEAEEKYANFLDGEDRDYLYFKHFKMALHKSEVMLIHSSFFLPFALFFFFFFFFASPLRDGLPTTNSQKRKEKIKLLLIVSTDTLKVTSKRICGCRRGALAIKSDGKNNN